MLFNWKEAHPDPADCQKVYMLATTVSSKILQAFARIEGFKFEVRASNQDQLFCQCSQVMVMMMMKMMVMMMMMMMMVMMMMKMMMM